MGLNEIIKSEVQNFLTEGLSDVLYHFTYIPHLIKILKLNKFATSSNLGSNADQWKDKGRFFFFSTQRSKGMSGYGRNHGNVCLVLDGMKLNQRFKGFPTDYWNWSKNPKDYDNKSNYIHALQSSELEDRIVTNKPYIDDAKQYIKAIHILTANGNNETLRKTDLDNIINEVNDIPIYFYNDENSFKLQDTSKAIPRENISLRSTTDDYEEPDRSLESLRYFRYIAPIIILKNDINDGYNDERDAIEKLLKQFLESVNKNSQKNFDDIMGEINATVKKMSSPWYNDDAYYSLAADIHNQRGNPDTYFREILKLILNDMKKWRVNNLKDYVKKKTSTKID